MLSELDEIVETRRTQLRRLWLSAIGSQGKPLRSSLGQVLPRDAEAG